MRVPNFNKGILGNVMQTTPQHMPHDAPILNESSYDMLPINSRQDTSGIPSSHPQQNPFAMEQSSLGGMPDVPLHYGGGMTEILLGDTDIPQEIREKYWFIFNKDNVLTFLDEERKRSKMLNLDVIKIDILNNTPYYDYNFDLELKWDILRNAFETKLDRALGFKSDSIKNERIVLQSQFSESKQITEQNGGGSVKEGFFKRLLGRR